MNLAILAFSRNFHRFTSRLHTLGPWVKFLISVVGTVLHTSKNITVRIPGCKKLKENKKKWTPHRFLHRGPKKAVEHDSDIHFDLA